MCSTVQKTRNARKHPRNSDIKILNNCNLLIYVTDCVKVIHLISGLHPMS